MATHNVGDVIHVYAEIPHADRLDGFGAEGFWVEVTAPGQGLVRNHLVYLPFAFGERVEFDPNPDYPDGSPVVRVPHDLERKATP